MCWPFPVTECTALAPLYAALGFALIAGVGIHNLLTRDTVHSDRLTGTLILVVILLVGVAIAASDTGMVPEPIAQRVLTVATPLGYFGILVFGPFAFAGLLTLVGATAIVITHQLIGEYA
jgi:hypothetical protein